MLKSIPLANLVASDRNVRRASDPVADAQLAADIAAHGLLQNLVVTPAKPRGTYAVEAGGRRLAALKALQAEGALPEGHAVPCLVLGTDGSDAEGATEASLAENLQRLAMNPADECLAFGKLIEDGADVEGVARRFGLTVRHVEGRLRLAGLHPVVFEALGAGEITLDAAKAYAATPDQERQLWVFEQLHASWSGAHPDSIRRMMVSATVPATDRRLRFVGKDAYLAAGGRLERDLFADDADARVLDVAVLEHLAADKLEVEAAWLANEYGYAFVRASLDSYVQPWRHDDLRRAPIDLPEPGEEERVEWEAIETEIGRLVAVLEVGSADETEADGYADDAARAEAETKIAELEARLRAIAGRPPVLEPDVRGTVGFFLLIDEDGIPRLDRTPYERVGATDGADAPGGDSRSVAGDGSADPRGESAGAAGSTGAGTVPARPRLSQRLVEELAMQRRDVLALHVASDPELAFDLAVFLMVRDEGGYCYESAGSSLVARAPSDPVLRSAMPDAPVQALLAAASGALDRSWTAHEGLPARFDAFRQLPRAAREAWLGAAVARTLEASAGEGGRPCAFHDHLGTLLGIDVAAHWRPTALNWFDRVPKALCLEALEDVGGPELAARHAKAKKADIAEACGKLFAGEGIVGPEITTAALAWVPGPMRFNFPPDDAPPRAADEIGVGDTDVADCPDQVPMVAAGPGAKEAGDEAIDAEAMVAGDDSAAFADQPGEKGGAGIDASRAPGEETGRLTEPAKGAAKPASRKRPRRKARKASSPLDKAA